MKSYDNTGCPRKKNIFWCEGKVFENSKVFLKKYYGILNLFLFRMQYNNNYN